MHSKTLLIGIALIVVTLSGCTSPDDNNQQSPNELQVWEANYASHPGWGYPVADNLPEQEEQYQNWPADWHKPQALTSNGSTLHHMQELTNDVPSGAGIAIFGQYAYVGSYTNANFNIIDLSNSSALQKISSLEAQAGDIDIIAYPPTAENDARLIATTSTRASDIIIIDVTNPEEAAIISTITTTQGNHNHKVVPGTPILYNAPSTGSEQLTLLDGSQPTGKNDIWDLTDPENPIHVKDFENGYGCHAIDFYINANENKYLAFCAGIEVTQIWDITDPLNPTVLSEVPFPLLGLPNQLNPGGISPASFSHLAMANGDGTVMIVGDETGGGLAPGCDAQQGPLGNVWFYDITDPTKPERLGQYSPQANEQNGGCTAHFGDVIDGKDWLLMSYYTAGVALIDFTDPSNPVELDLWQPEYGGPCSTCGVWDVQYYQGYILTGDITRGMDFLHLME